LQGRVQQLESQLAALMSQAPDRAPPRTSGLDAPLIETQLVSARVLGQQARQFLTSRALLDVGNRAGLENGAVALDAPLLDVGEASGLAPGRMVLDWSSIVGRISEVGRHTSCLQRITDESYRDLVRIVQVRDGSKLPGARGLLVGSGDGMCRVRMVDISQPVAVGDVVVADGLGGIVSTPPRYGTVARVAQSPGSAHWDIWVQPDADVRNLDVVSVLKTDVSAVRVAGATRPPTGLPSQGLP
jgi:cell shape-determining protein MreC